MRAPSATWETDYQHGRRAHRHRCGVCRKIINAGERVLMAKKSHGTLAIHAAHADERHSETYSWREVMTVWGNDYLRSCGFKIPA